MTALDWWIVTLRQSGDDEDTLYVVQAADADDAVALADQQIREENDIEADAEDAEESNIYINHVVRCGPEKPEHVRAPQ